MRRGEVPSVPARAAPTAESAQGALVVPISGPDGPADVKRLSRRLSAERDGNADAVPCDVAAVLDADAGTVDALARLQLMVRREGRSIVLLHASPDLRDLLDLMGLGDVVPCAEPSGLEARRQAEEREPTGRVEDEGNPGDPIA